MNCLIADDEPLAREGLKNFVADIPFLKLIGVCGNAMEVMTALNEKKIDLLFLDIQMPKMSGIKLLKALPHPPLTVITTAFQTYAIESYELDVTDYLLKPFSFDRFVMAVNKAKKQFDLRHNQHPSKVLEEEAKEYFFVRCDRSYEKIFFNDILHIEALQNYVLIVTALRKYTVYITMKSIEDQLPQKGFLKINRSYIINLSKVNSIDGNEVVVNNVPLQIGKSYKDTVMQVLLNPNLIKR